MNIEVKAFILIDHNINVLLSTMWVHTSTVVQEL